MHNFQSLSVKVYTYIRFWGLQGGSVPLPIGKLLIILRYSYLLDDCNYFVVTCSAVDKVLNAYYVKLLAPPTIIHPLYSKKNKNGTVH